MSKGLPVTTKPSQYGTFGGQEKHCLYDGATLLKSPVDLFEGAETYYCPRCGLVLNFIKR